MRFWLMDKDASAYRRDVRARNIVERDRFREEVNEGILVIADQGRYRAYGRGRRGVCRNSFRALFVCGGRTQVRRSIPGVGNGYINLLFLFQSVYRCIRRVAPRFVCQEGIRALVQ